MSEAQLRDRLKRLGAAEAPAPSFESVMAPARRRSRPRLGRVALAAAALAGAVVLGLHARSDRAPKLAALTPPPTTDWLLKTPQADWLTHVQKAEKPHAP